MCLKGGSLHVTSVGLSGWIVRVNVSVIVLSFLKCYMLFSWQWCKNHLLRSNTTQQRTTLLSLTFNNCKGVKFKGVIYQFYLRWLVCWLVWWFSVSCCDVSNITSCLFHHKQGQRCPEISLNISSGVSLPVVWAQSWTAVTGLTVFLPCNSTPAPLHLPGWQSGHNHVMCMRCDRYCRNVDVVCSQWHVQMWGDRSICSDVDRQVVIW